ncbi:MAG: hypothetical protein QOE45_2544 [Frankiaceae bacterium]|nr:hypothetical protein [Frankiaceae bacterium]
MIAAGPLRIALDQDARVTSVRADAGEPLGTPADAPCWRLLLRRVEDPPQGAPKAVFSGPSGEWWAEHLFPAGEVAGLPLVDSADGTSWHASTVACAGEALPIASSLRVSGDTWRLDVTNDSFTHVVTAVDLAPFGRLASTPDDVLLMPFWGGERITGAADGLRRIAEDTSDPLATGAPRVVRTGDEHLYALPYSGSASMPWLYYERSGLGLYLGQHDPAAGMVHLRALSGPDGLELSLRLPCDVVAGHSWQSPPLVVAGHDDGWHGAAGRYRAWWDTAFPPPVGAGVWGARSGLQITFLKTGDGRIQHRFADLPALLDELRPLGLDTLSPYGWSQGGFDSSNPDFYPDLDLGGPVAMAASYAAIRERGGEIMGYLNGRLFSDRSTYSALRARCAAKAADGSVNHEAYGGSEFTTCCPGSPDWREVIGGFAEMLTGDYGVRVVFLDQLAAAPSLACHDGSHLHEGPHRWNAANAALARDVLARIRARDADAALAVEGVSDVLVPYVLVQSYVSLYAVGHDMKFPELFAFTFPEVIQADTVPYTREPESSMYDALGTMPIELARHWVCRSVATGMWLGVMDQTRADAAWWPEVRGLLALRHAAAPWLAAGSYRDTVDVVAAPPGVAVTTTRPDRPGNGTLCVAHGPHDGRVALRWPHPTASARALCGDGGSVPVDVVVADGAVAFDLPEGLLRAVVVSE